MKHAPPVAHRWHLLGSRLVSAAAAGFALSTLGGYVLSLWVGLFGFKEVRTTGKFGTIRRSDGSVQATLEDGCHLGPAAGPDA